MNLCKIVVISFLQFSWRKKRGSFECSTRDVEARRCKSPWKTRASSRLIRTVCKLKRVSVRLFFLFSFSFFFFFLFLLFLLDVHQLVLASGLNADLNTKRETAILLRPWGPNNSTIVPDVYSSTGRSDRNETNLNPFEINFFPRVLIEYKLIRTRFFLRVCVYERRNKVVASYV